MERIDNTQPHPDEPMPADQRDRLIVALRRKGCLRKVAHHPNMSKPGVASSFQRIAEGRPGNDPRT